MGCDPASPAASSRGMVYYAAGQVHFPANMGENLLQGSFDLLTHRGSFHRHQFDSSSRPRPRAGTGYLDGFADFKIR